MGYRSKIYNIPIKDSTFELIKQTLKKYKLIVRKVFRVIKGRNIYMVELENNKHVRVDIYSKKNSFSNDRFRYQQYLYESGVNVARIIGLSKTKKQWLKVSEWIEGVRIGEVWNRAEVFEKCGEQIAKLNSVKDPKTGCFLGLADFSKLNLIWTKENEVYIIDLLVSSTEVVDYSVVKTLIMGLSTRTRIEHFLNGYKKIRDTDRILEILENQNWKWKDCGLSKGPPGDILI